MFYGFKKQNKAKQKELTSVEVIKSIKPPFITFSYTGIVCNHLMILFKFPLWYPNTIICHHCLPASHMASLLHEYPTVILEMPVSCHYWHNKKAFGWVITPSSQTRHPFFTSWFLFRSGSNCMRDCNQAKASTLVMTYNYSDGWVVFWQMENSVV